MSEGGIAAPAGRSPDMVYLFSARSASWERQSAISSSSRITSGNNQGCRCRRVALQRQLGVLRTWSTCSPHDLLLGKGSRRYRQVLASHLEWWSIATARDNVAPMPAAGLQD